MTTVVYPGSFNPFHLGHLAVVRTAAEMFDKVVVLIARNTTKEFEGEWKQSCELRREAILKDLEADYIDNVEVQILPSRTLIHQYMIDRGYHTVVRGVRNSADAASELQYFEALQDLYCQTTEDCLNTILLPTCVQQNISSSLIRELIVHDGWVELIGNYVPKNTAALIFKQNKESFMKEVWTNACKGLAEEGVSKDVFELEFLKLKMAYGDENRHYHNLDHVFNCLVEMALDSEDSSLKSTGYLGTMTAFWHDYNLVQEEVSALLCDEFLKMIGCSEEGRTPIYAWILSTKDANNSGYGWFRDIDRSILGKDEKAYATYSENIEKEFTSECSLGQFLEGRKEWLEKTLGVQRIYRTDSFHKKYEFRARKNLNNELTKIEDRLAVLELSCK